MSKLYSNPVQDDSFVFKKRGIKDIDASVLNYFKNVLDIRVPDQDSNFKKVPVFFGTSERRILSDNPDLIDEAGTLKKPFMRLRRTEMEHGQEPFYGSVGEAEGITIYKKVHDKSQNLQNRYKDRYKHKKKDLVIYEIFKAPFPDYFSAMYELDIETVYITHANEIMETIWQTLDFCNSFKIPDYGTKSDRKDIKGKDGFFYVGIMQPEQRDESNLDDFTEQERFVKYVITFKVGGIVIGNTKNMPEYQDSNEDGTYRVRRYYTYYKIKLNEEETIICDTDEERDAHFS